MMGAIKPALMHRIQSELRSRACSGASRTGMGDTLGSPRVAPLLIFVPFIFISRLFFHNFYGDLFLLPWVTFFLKKKQSLESDSAVRARGTHFMGPVPDQPGLWVGYRWHATAATLYR